MDAKLEDLEGRNGARLETARMDAPDAASGLPGDGLRRVPVEPVLQFLHEGGETCTVLLRSDERVGFLYLVGGDLVDARLGRLEGLHAAFRLLRWNGPSVELCPGEAARPRTISEPFEKVVDMVRRARRAERAGGPLTADFPAVADPDATLDLTEDGPVPGAPPRPGAVAHPDGAAEHLSPADVLDRLLAVPAEGAAVVDSDSGMCIESAGELPFFEIVAAMSVDLLGVEEEVIRRMASRDRVEDVLVTLGQQHHVLRPVRSCKGLALFAVFDRRKTRLAWARHRVAELETRLRL